MTKLLRIADELSLPLEVVTMRVAIYGTSGSGKTTFARLVAEKVHESRHRFCAIDLKNDWWGLKSSADGSAAGIPLVIFGGPRRDVQLLEDSGDVVAETVASIEQSVIIDLDAMSKGKQIKFLTTFLDKLYDVNRHPLLVLADEADRYAPQKPMSIEANVALGASEDICRRGRKRGIGSMWLTQRTAVLNKNVSDICDLTVVFRTPGARDLKELEERVGRIASKEQTAEVLRLAPGLEDGQAIFLSSHPKLRGHMPDPVRPIQLPLPWTFDSSATPGLGQRRREPRVLAETDLAAIEQRMVAQVEQAKANDPAALKRQIADLQKQLRERPVPTQAVKEVERVEVPVFQAGDISTLQSMTGEIVVQGERLERLAKTIQAALIQAQAANGRHKSAAQAHNVPATRKTPSPVAPTPRNKNTPVQQSVPPEGLTGPEQRILDALAWMESIGVIEPMQTAVAFLAGYTIGGGAWNNPRGALRTKGLLDYRGDRLVLTEAGRGLARHPEGALTTEELQRRVMERLPGPERKILQVLIDVYPEEISKTDLAQRSGYAEGGGAFANPLGRLRSLGLADYPVKGMVSATTVLFLE